MNINPSGMEDLKSNMELLFKYRDNRRNQESIISELKDLLRNLRKETFIPYIVQMMNSIKFRHSSKAFQNLMSPLKQLAYVIDLYFSIQHECQDKSMLDEDEWDRLTLLLEEIEMTYFGAIGFFEEEPDPNNTKAISVTLKSFFDYHSNAQLCFDEQTMYRIQNNFEKFDQDLVKIYGFETKDIIDFCNFINDLQHKKADGSMYYVQNPEKWKELATGFLEKGLEREEWANQPELEEFINYLKNPADWFRHLKTSLFNCSLGEEKVEKLIDYLKYDENILKSTTVYYSDSRNYFKTPIVELNEEEFLVPNIKFLLEAFYNGINLKLAEVRKEKYTQNKNKVLENRVLEVFREFFGKETKYFQSFYFDKQSKAEQDLLIFSRGNLIIVEIKDFKFRSPLRTPLKAFDKIRSDFKGGIQKAYDQCKRFEDKYLEGIDFKIYDSKNNKELYEIRPDRIRKMFSIVVTQHKYGGIQTDLKELLIKDKDDVYPWSVCVDDLEIFLLGLKKIKKTTAVSSFFTFLDLREAYHERLICSDELEMCGWFINSQRDFDKFANGTEYFTTDIRMSEVFDAHYANGLGFKDEINIKRKRQNPLGDFAKKFDLTVVSGNDLFGDKAI